MKYFNSLLYLVALLVLAEIQFGQIKPQAILIDEFGTLGCEDLSARQDAFLSEIQNEKNAKGYAVIYAESGDLKKNLRYESYINGHLNARRFNNHEFITVRGPEREKLKIEFWKVPKDADTPVFPTATWSYVIPQTTKPYIFTADTYGGGPCESTSYVKLFADLLLANPKSHGNVVIRDKTNRNFRKRQVGVVRELVNRYNIPLHRLKFFFVKDKNYPYDFTDVEYWLVP